MPTRALAQSVQIHLCKLSYDGSVYVLNPALRPQGTDEISRIDDFTYRVVPTINDFITAMTERMAHAKTPSRA